MRSRDTLRARAGRWLARWAILLGSAIGLAHAPAAATAASAPSGKAEPPRPNIVLILSDDMGFSDLGCYGGEIETPQLDRLAAGGLRFTEFYNTARCCPTRASLLTGLYPHQAAVGHMMEDKRLDGYRGDLSRQAVTLAEVLHAAGYATYAAGKWHVTRSVKQPTGNWPLERGFERYYGIITGSANYFRPNTLTRDNAPITIDTDPEYRPKDYYLTDAISDQAVRYVNEHRQRKATAPLFLYVAYTAAHWPMQAPAGQIAKYRGRYDAGYGPVRQARYERLKRLGLIRPGWKLSPQAGDWDRVERKDWEARCMEVYAAMVDRMDHGIGRIVEALRAGGQLDNTLLFYLQDNGGCAEEVGRAKPKEAKKQLPMPGPEDTWIAYGRGWANVSNTPFREYKHWVHEGGIATPLVVHWPAGVKRRGELEHQPGHLIDVMATCVDVSGAAYPAQLNGHAIRPMEGWSLVPAFQGKTISREALCWEHEGNRAIRVGRWKLVAKGPAGKWELYDVDQDRTELHDLAGSDSDRVRSMAGQWEGWARRTSTLPWPWNPPYGEPLAKKKKTKKAG